MDGNDGGALLIDVGGTHTRLAVCNGPNGNIFPQGIKIYESRVYPGIDKIIQNYRSSLGILPKAVVIGVAGPVTEDSAGATNLTWTINAKKLKTALGFSEVRIINDVEALGYAIEVLGKNDIEIIHSGKRCLRSPAALIAPGTGLGESFLVPSENGFQVFPSEGGHADFAPTNAMEIGLLDFLLKRGNHVSYERVCSGPGICNIYRYLADKRICFEPSWLKKRIETAEDPAAIIARNALSGTDATAITVRTVEIFVSILGAEAGNLAMRYGAGGGIYIGGGIAPKIRPFLTRAAFVLSFKAKGRLSGYVSSIPVMLIRKPEANLWGLANYAQKTLTTG